MIGQLLDSMVCYEVSISESFSISKQKILEFCSNGEFIILQFRQYFRQIFWGGGYTL